MDPYQVLEISPAAGITEEDVRKAYRIMVSSVMSWFFSREMDDWCVRVCVGVKAKKWHPDRKLDDQEIATKKFKEVRGLPFFLLTDIIVWV